MSDATNIPCPSCGSPAGDVCRTKAGKHRTTCPQRERKAGSSVDAAPDPLAFPCAKCRVGAGVKCKNYLGQGKQSCPNRGEQISAATGVYVADLLDGFNMPPTAAPAAAPTPAPAPRPAPVEDFDETTPPPKTRPKGSPLDAHVTLPPGEDTAGIFAQWNREGRVPEGAVLAEYIGRTPLGSGTDSGYTFVAGANPFGVRAGDEIPAGPFGPYLVRVTVKRQQCPRCWAIFTPKGGA